MTLVSKLLRPLAAPALACLWWLLARAGARLRQRAGAWLGGILFHLARRRRWVAARNLELCFPTRSAAWRAEVLRAHFRALGQSLIDRSVLWFGDAAEVAKLVSITGLEHWPREGPVILLAPHFIGLDAGWTRLTVMDTVASMYQPQRNPAIDALVRRGRCRHGAPVLIGKHQGIRGLVRCLAAGTPIYYLPDMDFGARNAVFVPFFGVPAATLTTLARLAEQQGASVVPCITRWDPVSGHYTVRLEAPWAHFPGPDPLVAARRMNQAIENWVREMPAQYLWPHKRFKTRPEGEPSLYAVR